MLLVITLFIPTIYSTLGGEDRTLDNTILQWGVPLSFLVASYLIIEILEEKISYLIERILQVCILSNIALYIPLFYIVSKEAVVAASPQLQLFFKVIFNGILWLPVCIFLLLTIQVVCCVERWASRPSSYNS